MMMTATAMRLAVPFALALVAGCGVDEVFFPDLSSATDLSAGSDKDFASSADLAGADLNAAMLDFGSGTDALPSCPCSMFGTPGLYCANDTVHPQPSSCSLPFNVANASQLWRCTAPNIWTLQSECANLAGTSMTCKSCPTGCPDACRQTNAANDTSCQTATPTIAQCTGS